MSDRTAPEVVSLRERISVLERMVAQTAVGASAPFRTIGRQKVRGVRYARPGPKEYFVITSSRLISILNAMWILYLQNFYIEWCVLARVFLETVAKQKYVMSGISEKGVDSISSAYLEKYFNDTDRDDDVRRKNFDPKMQEIHRRVAKKAAEDIAFLKSIGLNAEGTESEYADSQSNLYRMFSYFTHGRYPEAMHVFNFYTLEICFNGSTEFRDFDVEMEFYKELIETAERSIQVSILNLARLNPSDFKSPAVRWAMDLGLQV